MRFMPRIKHRVDTRLQTSYTAAQLARRYGFPSLTQTAHDHVAIIELGGGFSVTDINLYCKAVGCKVPPVHAISVDGAKNSFTGNPNSADGECALDVQNVIGATGGKIPLLVYFAPNTSQGFANAIMQVAKDNKACALSISWGQDESGWTAAERAAMDTALQMCGSGGTNISCFAASGDDGSADGGSGNNVDYPASSPYCVGCGGTTITGSADGQEMAWSYGGGGYSANYPRPGWQTVTGNPQIRSGRNPVWREGLGFMRGVPDVACDADPNTGYTVFVGGKSYVFGGTSAVAPMWAALTAMLSTIAGKRLGFLGPQLYSLNNLDDITSGVNGAYSAVKGWDPCTGLGVPSAAFTAAMNAKQRKAA